MIDSKLTKLKEEEILELINEELKKDNSQVDMDYIDLCYDLLEIKKSAFSSNDNNLNSTKLKIKKPIKALLIAATFIVVIVSTFTVSAQFNLNIPQKIVQLINGNAEIEPNLEIANTKADKYTLLDSELAVKLSKQGISPVTFPEEMIKEKCTITNIENVTIDETISADEKIEFEYNGQYGCLLINQFMQNFAWSGKKTNMNIISGQIIRSNGLDILVFEHKNYCSIIYKDSNTEYNIYIECDIDTALQFAKSIK